MPPSLAATTYAVRCARCDRRAAASMATEGPKGSYRQPSLRLRAQRVTCAHCGLIRELAPEHGQDYQLWYRASVRSHTVWAATREHLDFLVAWMTGQVDERALPWADADIIETLPSRRLARHDRWLYATRPIGETPYLIESYVAEAVRARVPDCHPPRPWVASPLSNRGLARSCVTQWVRSLRASSRLRSPALTHWVTAPRET